MFIIVFPLEAFQSQIQSKILTINSDFLEINCNCLFVTLIEAFAIIGGVLVFLFFFFNEHVLLLSPDNSDPSFEKRDRSSTGIFGQNHNGARRQWCDEWSSCCKCAGDICPRAGSHPWGASGEHYKLISKGPDIIWLCLFWLLFFYFPFAVLFT